MLGFDFKNICKKSIGAFLCTSMAGGALTQAFEQGKSEKQTSVYANSASNGPKQEEKSSAKWWCSAAAIMAGVLYGLKKLFDYAVEKKCDERLTQRKKLITIQGYGSVYIDGNDTFYFKPQSSNDGLGDEERPNYAYVITEGSRHQTARLRLTGPHGCVIYVTFDIDDKQEGTVSDVGDESQFDDELRRTVNEWDAAGEAKTGVVTRSLINRRVGTTYGGRPIYWTQIAMGMVDN